MDQAAQHPAPAEALRQRVEVRDAVQDRQDHAIRPEPAVERAHRRRKAVRLAGQDRDVEERVGFSLAQQARREVHVAERAPDRQSKGFELRLAGTADEEGDVGSRRGKPAAEIASDRARAEHQNAHRASPIFSHVRIQDDGVPVNGRRGAWCCR